MLLPRFLPTTDFQYGRERASESIIKKFHAHKTCVDPEKVYIYHEGGWKRGEKLPL